MGVLRHGVPREIGITILSEGTCRLSRSATGRRRARLEASGHWFPNGAITVASERPDLVVTIDDRPVGTTRVPAATIECVSEGQHVLALSDPEDARAFERRHGTDPRSGAGLLGALLG